MINPGVITLASLNDGKKNILPYRFCIEDNIGEAIHIHFKDIRLDLTVKQFLSIASQCYDIINDLVSVENFDAHSFDPVNLMEISGSLCSLSGVEIKEVFLKEILVDTFDLNGKRIFAPISQSRVFKALCGHSKENDSHTVQRNYLHYGAADFVSNSERIKFNLEQIKKNGYPVNGELIGINSKNEIWDGQHRAACLYYLYGNIKVPVRTLVYEEENVNKNPMNCQENWIELEKQLWEKDCSRNHTEKNAKKSFVKKVSGEIKKIIWKPWNKTDGDVLSFNYRFNNLEDRLSDIEKKISEVLERV